MLNFEIVFLSIYNNSHIAFVCIQYVNLSIMFLSDYSFLLCSADICFRNLSFGEDLSDLKTHLVSRTFVECLKTGFNPLNDVFDRNNLRFPKVEHAKLKPKAKTDCSSSVRWR